jgi:acyl-CoA reductase-like NAD-dependent aldehyde dehydrogenase
MGAPIDLARKMQTPVGLTHIRNAAAVLERFDFESEFVAAGGGGVQALGAPPGRPGNFGGRGTRILHCPIGVCGLITPWNWPMNQVTLKAAYALAAGCTTVLKPSEFSPLSASLFAEAVDAAGFPRGVFNLVHGNGPVAGAALASHPLVDLVSFTGSNRAGAAVSKAAADTVKKVALEMGGKGPNLIFEDVDDLARTVRSGVASMMLNSGQSCNAPSRMLVQRSVYSQALRIATAAVHETKVNWARLARRHSRAWRSGPHHSAPATGLATCPSPCLHVPSLFPYRAHLPPRRSSAGATRLLLAQFVASTAPLPSQVGSPDLAGKHIGPLFNATQFERVQRLIRSGIDQGATLLAGGPGKPTGHEVGYYARPTLFADVDNSRHSIAREEIFGPVLCVIPFDDEDDAVEIANDSPYGLTSYVQVGTHAWSAGLAAKGGLRMCTRPIPYRPAPTVSPRPPW